MTPERWKQVDQLMQEALEREPAERSAFLAEVCGGDDDLRGEIESLLGFHERAGDFIEAPPTDMAADWLIENESRAGQTIGHYQLMRPIGRGGMGEVYLARDTRLERPAALKLLRTNLTQDAARVRRFRQEARAASALNHPNIITIYEVGQADSTAGAAHYIAAEFVDGQTLRKLCQGEGLTLGAALDILIQVAGALTTAHEAGIVHRDIKPENIMLRKDGLAKVLDFGLAKLTEQAMRPHDQSSGDFTRVTTQPGVVMGTISYMSPEQVLTVNQRLTDFGLNTWKYVKSAFQADFTYLADFVHFVMTARSAVITKWTKSSMAYEADYYMAKLNPALTLVLTFRPRATVWLWLCRPAPAPPVAPALMLLLTLRPRATVWLWFILRPPALTFDLIFISSSPVQN